MAVLPDPLPAADGEDVPLERVSKDRRGSERSGTEVIARLPDGAGEIHYYPRSQQISATCRVHGDDCRRFRTTKQGPRSEGRPIGLLVAWLLQGRQYRTKVDHCSQFSLMIARRERIEARKMFAELPGASGVLQGEAPSRTGDEEPLG